MRGRKTTDYSNATSHVITEDKLVIDLWTTLKVVTNNRANRDTNRANARCVLRSTDISYLFKYKIIGILVVTGSSL
jgi:hypothetical protein